MTIWITLMPLATAGAMWLFSSPAQAQISDPASLARIRAALKGPPPALLPALTSTEIPTFRVEVRQPFVDLQPIDEESFESVFRHVGLSVDWTLLYTTINENSSTTLTRDPMTMMLSISEITWRKIAVSGRTRSPSG